MATVLVIGATGDVGQGIVSVLLRSGYRVIAASRGEERLRGLVQRLGFPAALRTLRGSVENEATAAALLAAIREGSDSLDAVITTVSAPRKSGVLLFDRSADDLSQVLRDNLITHFVSAKTFIPAIANGGAYLSIGGGLADFVRPGFGHHSMAQAALRMMLRTLAVELSDRPVVVRELLIASMVNGESRRSIAQPEWVTDLDVGEHVRAILERPHEFPDLIQTLRSRGQVGLP
ncbi:MAG: SDR family oxidoreductase [Candidatus Acidiferrales bacterium]|jgi:NAD(P)-dependent dehydrogenase (short-subunit alcohol dehydrogenase family)